MWGWISGSKSPAVNLPVNVGEEQGQCLAGRLVFKLFKGSHKTSTEPLSVFKFESSPSTTPEQNAAARAEFKRLRVLRHPSVLKYTDGVDSESIVVIVTEPVVPLLHHIQSEEDLSADGICWGLYQIITALKFLHEDCKIPHRNLYTSSIFISHSGDWKLGGVAWCEEPSPLSLPSRVNQYLSKYDAPEVLRGVTSSATSVDVWQLGVLIWELFNGNLSSPQSLRDTSKIPSQLVTVYRECVSSNFKSRPAIGTVFQKLSQTAGYFDNSFVSANRFLDELSMKERSEKEAFFMQLPDKLDAFPEQFSKYKLLPALTTTFQFGEVGVEVLASLFKLGKLLNDDEYKTTILPCVIKLFSSTDRAMRIQLLTQLHNFIEYLDNKTVDSQIFPAVCTGFTDTIPGMREQTVKSMLQLTAKLSETTIDNQLLKFLAKAQTDTEPPIRTNTTICISKICCHFSDSTRRKVLLPAFLRSLKDPFLHARNAGLLSLGCTSQYYGETEVATRILPAICPMLMDHEKPVREQALKTVRLFIEKIERYHKGIPDETPRQSGASHSAGEPSGEEVAKGWASWAVSSVSNITSKYSQPNQRIGEIEKPAATPPDVPDAPVEELSTPGKTKSEPVETTSMTDKESDGWDEGWDGIPAPAMPKTKSSMKLGATKSKPSLEDDTLIASILKEEQGSLKLEAKPVRPKSPKELKSWDTVTQNNKVKLTPWEGEKSENSELLSSYFSSKSSDFFGQMGVSQPEKAPPPAKSEWDDFNLKVPVEQDSNWDDWGMEGGVSDVAKSQSRTNTKSQAENKALAQKKVQSKKAMPSKPIQKSGSPSFNDWNDDWGDSKENTSTPPRPSLKPPQKLLQKPVQKPDQKPVQKPLQKPDQKPDQKPVQKPLQKPVQKPLQKPLQKSVTSSPSSESWDTEDWGKSSPSTAKVAETAVNSDWNSGWQSEPQSREEKRLQQRERRINKTSGTEASKKT